MNILNIYEALVPLKDDPEAFAAKSQEFWNKYFNSLPADQARKLAQLKWSLIDAELRHIKDPIARCNKSMELMISSLQTLQLALTNPNAIIARSQDGSKAIILPINRKKEK